MADQIYEVEYAYEQRGKIYVKANSPEEAQDAVKQMDFSDIDAYTFETNYIVYKPMSVAREEFDVTAEELKEDWE